MAHMGNIQYYGGGEFVPKGGDLFIQRMQSSCTRT